MLKVRNIHKRFNQTPVLNDVSLQVNEGEILSLTGESGCGKSTLLRIVAGLEKADEGAIILKGRDITRLSPEKRKFGFVFQNLSLFPHLDVEQNIQFGLRRKDKDPHRLKELLAMTGLQDLEKRYPHQLSGGQQQRVALARALATDPDLLILDEPFSSLDELLKAKIREEIFELLRELGITTIMVSHQAYDSFLIADQLIIMKEGRILQKGAPSEVYQNPVSEYVSTFFGANVIIEGKREGDIASTPFGNLTISDLPEEFRLCIRPENILITTEADANISGRITRKFFKGPHDVLSIESDDGQAVFSMETERSVNEVGDTVYLKIPENKVLIFS